MRRAAILVLPLAVLSQTPVQAEEPPPVEAPATQPALSVESLGACLLERLGQAALLGNAAGRGNVWMISRNRLGLSLYYNQIDEMAPMPYSVTVFGGYGGPKRGVEAVDFYFEMQPLTDEEIQASLAEALADDKDTRNLLFPEGLGDDFIARLDGSAEANDRLSTLVMMYPGSLSRFTRPLTRLLGVMAYDLSVPIASDDMERIQAAFWAHAEAHPLTPETTPLITVTRDNLLGRRYEVSECFQARSI